MPEYLSHGSNFANRPPEEVAAQLERQREQLIRAMNRLQEAGKIDPKILDHVVSV